MIKILVADDHAITRSGLKMIIENYFTNSIVEEVNNGSFALEKVKNSDYNMILLAVNKPKPDPAQITDILLASPESRILMFSMFNEVPYAKRYLQAGAMGYVSKTADEGEIKKAITNILDNKRYVSSGLLERIIHEIYTDKFSNPFESLSHRELEILKHLVNGRKISDISAALKIESSTIGTYKSRIFEKLHCATIEEVNSLAGLYNFTSIIGQQF